MALIHCPNCRNRISNQVTLCPNCGHELGTASPEEIQRFASRRYQRQRYRTLNLSYLGLTFLVVGAIWWFMAEPQGWVMPPPVVAISLVMIGAVVYMLARAWMLWLKMQRSRGR